MTEGDTVVNILLSDLRIYLYQTADCGETNQDRVGEFYLACVEFQWRVFCAGLAMKVVQVWWKRDLTKHSAQQGNSSRISELYTSPG